MQIKICKSIKKSSVQEHREDEYILEDVEL